MRVYHEALIRCAAALQIAILEHAQADEIDNAIDKKINSNAIRRCLDQAYKEYSSLQRATK